MNYQRAMSEVREISARLESLEVEVRRMDEQIKAKREEIERYAADLQPLENLRLERVRREKELQDLRDRERSTVGAIRELTGTISSKETEMASLDREIQRAQSELDERVAHRDRARKIGSIVTWIEGGFFIPAVESIEKQVMYALNQEFNHHLRRWFSTLVDDHSKDIRVDESFTPIVEQDGFEMDVNYLSGGGEKTSVALSYRLALNTLVRSTSTTRKPDTLILDEPTDGFSIQQLYRMRDILMQMNIPQIIIVSHENELESFADHIVRVMKEGGTFQGS
ncbi:hypothetical protein [Thermogymnomonas acidicola]|uniref:hypothetical protein n=1 Tax=Thermogymnomonas acidicola TaxID=399579 RepID=UPI0009466250|nr:hypothetical protein [Thermogymnomonas acidicola]